MATKCVPLGYIDYRVYGANSTYMFGGRNGVASDLLYRIDADHNGTQIVDGSADLNVDGGSAINAVQGVFALSDNQTVFLMAANLTDDQYYLYKSVDNGSNFGDNAPAYDNGNWVSKIGDLGGTHTANVNILGEAGFLEASDGTLYYGEYNTNGSRTPGSTNDHVRVMRSTDNGDTWSALATWNTDGHQVTHCHHVSQDPYTGYIYIGFGDGWTVDNEGGGILRWDGSSTITDNTKLNAYGSVTGVDGINGYQTQCTSLMHTENYVYNPADQSYDGTPPDYSGIYRYDKDLTNELRINEATVPHKNYHALYWNLKTSNGTWVVGEILQVGSTDNSLYVYTSDDECASWHVAGVARLDASDTDGRSFSGFFEFNGKIYASCSRLSGKYRSGSIIFKIEGDFTESEPDTIHPVYWVDSSGTDGAAPNGYDPSTPWATLSYALTGDRVTHGARVILSPGFHQCATADVKWDANTQEGQTTDKTIVEGTEGQTWLEYDTGNSGTGFTLEAADGDIEFRKMRVFDQHGNPLTLSSGYDDSLTENVIKGKINWQ